jgi:hypothetical protein
MRDIPKQEIVANAFRGKLENGDLVVEFGSSEPQAPPAAGSKVSLALRVVMPPATAQRLVARLQDALQASLRQVRQPEAPVPPRPATPLSVRGQTPVNAPPDPAGEQAALLLRLVADLGAPYQYERSFRLSDAGLQANRYLLTMSVRDIAADPRVRVLEICRRMGMPDAARAEAETRFDTARCVHFGFEGDGGGIVCKLYLERAVPAQEAERARALSEPVLRHLAFKWPVLGGAGVVTRYLWHPSLSAAEVEARLAQIYQGAQAQASLAIATEVLRLAAGKAPPERLEYLEVDEHDNPRRSFDLNVYNAELQVRDLQPLLHRMRERFDIRPGQFQALYDQIKGRALGHVAGGMHRNAREFFNVYYGVAGFPKFAERFD